MPYPKNMHMCQIINVEIRYPAEPDAPLMLWHLTHACGRTEDRVCQQARGCKMRPHPEQVICPYGNIQDFIDYAVNDASGFDVRTLIGKKILTAGTIVANLEGDRSLRVIRRDGKDLYHSDYLIPGRINVAARNGRVEEILYQEY
jgi:hypothetical protein